jgi:hypothetical protein
VVVESSHEAPHRKETLVTESPNSPVDKAKAAAEEAAGKAKEVAEEVAGKARKVAGGLIDKIKGHKP